MPCFFPIDAWRVADQSKLVFVRPRKEGWIDALKVPCGQCVGCRLERSRQWAVRIMHEASLWPDNCFVTLTYAPEHLPDGGSLRLRDFQLFFKRLRKRYGDGIRFFHCGEYGDKFKRPHYHACIFNHDFDDKYLWSVQNGQRLYRSPSLEELWPYGFSSVGSLTFESAAYVARYVLKKVTGDRAADHYSLVDPDGLVYSVRPEYVTMSRRPGIASGWFDKFFSDVYPSDQVIVRGRPARPPRFYDKKFALLDPLAFDEVLLSRFEQSQFNVDNNTPERLDVRRQVLEAHLTKLPRKLESGEL